MRRPIAAFLFVLAVVGGATTAAQPQHASRWPPPRTEDGRPDLQGIWTNATITPFERPASFRDRAFLTDDEVKALERQAATRRDEDAAPRAGDVGSYNQFWFDSG